MAEAKVARRALPEGPGKELGKEEMAAAEMAAAEVVAAAEMAAAEVVAAAEMAAAEVAAAAEMAAAAEIAAAEVAAVVEVATLTWATSPLCRLWFAQSLHAQSLIFCIPVMTTCVAAQLALRLILLGGAIARRLVRFSTRPRKGKGFGVTISSLTQVESLGKCFSIILGCAAIPAR